MADLAQTGRSQHHLELFRLQRFHEASPAPHECMWQNLCHGASPGVESPFSFPSLTPAPDRRWRTGQTGGLDGWPLTPNIFMW
jgi:hypothetical protein